MLTLKSLLDYLVARAHERSTWLGLASLLTALGLSLSPQQAESVIAAGMAAAGLIAAFTKDKV